MNKLMSFVCLKYVYEKKGDMINALGEFVLRLISENRIQEINPLKIIDEFSSEFGFEIPYIPMQDILNRLAKRGYLRGNNGNFVPTKKITPYSFEELRQSQRIENKLDKLIYDFTEYVKTHYERDYSYTEALEVLLIFFEENLSDLLEKHQFDFTGESIDDELRIVALFISEAINEDDSIKDTLIEIAIGNLIINTIVFREFIPNRKKKYKFNCYLDSPILFEISGVNGKIRKRAYIDFLKLLTNSGIRLSVFEHNYDEFFETFHNSFTWVDNPNYDQSKASRATKYFMDNNFSGVDIQDFINKVKREIKDLGISIWPTPNPNENIRYQIDVNELEKMIKLRYEQGNWFFNENEINLTIQRDIESFEAIYKLRKYNKPRSLSDVEHIMVTTNNTLANIAKEFNSKIGNSQIIPVLIIDLALGSLVWVTSIPKIIEDFAKAKMIGKAISVIEPSDKLLSALRDKVLQEKNRGTIAEDESYLLLQTQQSRLLLMKYTLGDITRIDNRTPFEILRGFKLPEIQTINKLTTTIRKGAKNNSLIISSLISLAILSTLIFTILITNGVITTSCQFIENISDGILKFFEVFSYLFGFALIPFFFNMRENIYKGMCEKNDIEYEETEIFKNYIKLWQKIKNKFFSEE
jgi:hypothetical protein